MTGDSTTEVEADVDLEPDDQPTTGRAPTDPVVRDTDAGARGAVYALLARAFAPPDADLHRAFTDGSFPTEVRTLLDETSLDVEVPQFATDDDSDLLSARYNDLFVIGFSEYLDRTDGTLDANEPPVPLHESSYREDVSWNDVNLDLARAYDYFGVGIPEERREHHDHVRLLLEFAGFLARHEATVSEDAALARLDFLDRHLGVAVEGIADRIADEPGTGAYGALARLCDDVTAADRVDLARRLEGGT